MAKSLLDLGMAALCHRPGELSYLVSGIVGAHSGILLTHRGPAAVSSEIGGNDSRDWKVVGAFAIV
jgi:hypothetical protein